MAACELCELREYTRHYCYFRFPFEFKIIDCDSCDAPMAVLGEHRAEPTAEERAVMVEALTLVGRLRYGEGKFRIDQVMRQIPDHCHMHARLRSWMD
jgi:hypothetical protein